ncbi:MAG: phosphotransferase [archaeon]
MSRIDDLIDRESLEFVAASKISYNDCYVLMQSGEPRYFLKKTGEAEKEATVYEVFKKAKLGETLKLVDHGTDFILTEYYPNLTEYSTVFGTIYEIARFHNAGIENANYIKAKLKDSKFLNLDRTRAIARINKHPELVRKFYSNSESLIKWIEKNQDLPKNQTKILVHGDFNEHNLVRSSDKDFIFLDFESAMYDYPSWDICRPMLNTDSFETAEDLAKEYLKGRGIKSNLTEDLVKIKVDCVLKYVSLGLTVLLRDTPQIRARRDWYLSKTSNFIGRIIDEI